MYHNPIKINPMNFDIIPTLAKIKYVVPILLLLSLLLSSCSGGSSSISENASNETTPVSTIKGLAAYGAAITQGAVTLYSKEGKELHTAETDAHGQWKAEVAKIFPKGIPDQEDDTTFPVMVKVAAENIQPVWSLIFRKDVDKLTDALKEVTVNANPMTTAWIALAGINVGDGFDAKDTASMNELTQEKLAEVDKKTSEAMAEIIKKLPEKDQVSDTSLLENFRTTSFSATGMKHDAVLDAIGVKLKDNGKVQFLVPQIGADIELDPKSTQKSILEQINEKKLTLKKKIEDTNGGGLSTPKPILYMGSDGDGWGTKDDAWAGFTGALTFVATTDLTKPITITFKNKKFPKTSWWNVTSSIDSNGMVTITLPEWKSELKAGDRYSFGFNGNTHVSEFIKVIKESTNCEVNGQTCIIAYDKADLGTDDTELVTLDDYFTAYGTLFEKPEETRKIVENERKESKETLKKLVSKDDDDTQDTPNTDVDQKHVTGNSGQEGGLTDIVEIEDTTEVTTGCTPKYEVIVSANTVWDGGFGGHMVIKNIGECDIIGWEVALQVAEDGGVLPWNFTPQYSNGTLTLTPKPWASKNIAQGTSVKSGFGGKKIQSWLQASAVDADTVILNVDALNKADTKQKTLVADPQPPKPSIPPPTTEDDLNLEDGGGKYGNYLLSDPRLAGIKRELLKTIPETDNWRVQEGDLNNQWGTPKDCDLVRWGDIDSVSQECKTLMETHQFGGPRHTGASDQIALDTNGKPTKEAFGYLVEWGVYGRAFGVENTAAAQYSKFLFSFVRLQDDGTLRITDTWASLDKDDTGKLLGLPKDPFSSNLYANQHRGIMKRLIMLKARFPHLKTAFSIGGWSLSGKFDEVTDNSEKRAQLVKSSIEFANKFGFDGIDIDWEYPVTGGNQDNMSADTAYWEITNGRDEDAANYVLLLQELRAAITDPTSIGLPEDSTDRNRTKSGKIELSIAVGLGPKQIDAVNFGDFIDYLDTVNLMAYDFNGGWSTKASHPAPLYDNRGEDAGGLGGNYSEFNDHDAVLNILWNIKEQTGEALKHDGALGTGRKHKPGTGQTDREAILTDPTVAQYKEKLVLGIPFYGRGWTNANTTWSRNADDPTPIHDNPWFQSTQTKVKSFGESVLDTKDVLYVRDGQSEKIKANSRISEWPTTTHTYAWDKNACSNFVQVAGSIFGYDDEDGIYHKAKYVRDKGLGGVMVWEVDGDTDDAKLAKSFIAGLTADATGGRKVCMHR